MPSRKFGVGRARAIALSRHKRLAIVQKKRARWLTRDLGEMPCLKSSM